MDKIQASISILKRLPPAQINQNAQLLTILVPEYQNEIYSRIDQPLQVDSEQQFIKYEYNRDGDSYRSPTTNLYYPPLNNGYKPSEQLRSLEIKANALFNEYRKLYYQGGISMCCFLDKEERGFVTAWMIKKQNDIGQWNSTNVIDVRVDNKQRWIYKITTTVLIEFLQNNQQCGSLNLSAIFTKQKEESFKMEGDLDNLDLDAIHLARIGQMVEEQESFIRSQLDTIYIRKTKDIIFQTRFRNGEKQYLEQKKMLVNEFIKQYA